MDKICDIAFPIEEINNYYEYTSADGFAFLGAALAKLGKDYSRCLKAVDERDWTLKDSYKIINIKVTPNNRYVHTLWACAEFFYATKDETRLHKVATIVNNIGKYPSGMMRYCKEETYYLVPNATSAAIMIYVLAGRHVAAKKLLKTFLDQQAKNGNWHYHILDTDLNSKQIKNQEDCFHLAMIISHLRAASKLNPNLKTEYAVKKAMHFLNKKKPRCGSCKKTKDPWLCTGNIGWGIPFMYSAIKGTNLKLEETAKQATINCLSHKNFRVRGMAAWALISDK